MLCSSLAERSPNVNPYVSRIASLDRIQFAPKDFRHSQPNQVGMNHHQEVQ